MAAPTLSWNLVRVFGTWHNLDGTLKAGKYTVKIPARVTSDVDDDIVPAGTYLSGNLQVANDTLPSLDVMVPATDDPDIDQTGWHIQITVTFNDNSTTELYDIDVPYADRPATDGGTGNGVDLSTIALAQSLPQTNALYKVGVPGGLAKLNAAGQVIDANGDPVTGGGTGGGSGDVAGPASSVDNRLAVFSGTTGKIIKQPNADVSAGGFKVTDVASPTTSTDAANKDYVDGGLGLKLNSADLPSQVTTLFPSITLMVYSTTSTTWPALPSNLTSDPTVAWHFVGGDATHAPPSVAGNAVWDRPAA